MSSSAALDWSAIDTVLIDMDGTLLDLRYDNWFWREHVPWHYARQQGLTLGEARARLEPKFRAVLGTMDWYCLDYWSDALELDVAALKRASLDAVDYLPGAAQFLTRLAASGKRRVLVTNAHPTTLALKNERARLAPWFDACYSTHPFKAPKEAAAFWPRLAETERFEPQRTLFIDDSVPVLDAARAYGIAWLRAVRRPDSSRPAQDTGLYTAIEGVAELM